MNKRDLMMKRNDVARLFEMSSRRHRNCIRINTNNSFQHEFSKFVICWKLAKQGKEFLTEAILEGRKNIADIVCLDDGEVIEVLHTETPDRFEAKLETIPEALEVISYYTNEVIGEIVDEIMEWERNERSRKSNPDNNKE